MKIIYQIFLIIVIGLSLYLVRDDLKHAYDKVSSYVVENVAPSITQKNIASTIALQSDKIASFTKSVITPGALSATSKSNSQYDLASDASKVRLSVLGVINLTNINRASNGSLPALKENNKLDASAQIKLQDMLRQQYFEHVSPSGVGVADLARGQSYSYIIIGENLALGNFKDDKSLVDAWMASPGHRANILNNHYTEIGVAIGHGIFNGQDTWLAVQHFGLPRSACPSIDTVLKGQITMEENNIKTMSDDLAIRKEKIDSGGVYEGMTTNEQIAKYNELVVTYNNLIEDVKQKVSNYNSQIRAFNACLASTT